MEAFVLPGLVLRIETQQIAIMFRYSYIQLYWFLFALFWVFIINYACRSFSGRIEFMVLLFILFSVLAVILKDDDYIFTKIGRSFLTFTS